MNTVKNTLKKLWQDESGQGATEYILIMVVIGVLIFVFRGKLVELITDRTEDVSNKLKTAIDDISTPN